MTRGIHLKRLKNTDLHALGLSDEPVIGDGAGQPVHGAAPNLLSEADPVLSRLVGEVRDQLEGTLELLDHALSRVAREEPS